MKSNNTVICKLFKSVQDRDFLQAKVEISSDETDFTAQVLAIDINENDAFKFEITTDGVLNQVGKKLNKKPEDVLKWAQEAFAPTGNEQFEFVRDKKVVKWRKCGKIKATLAEIPISETVDVDQAHRDLFQTQLDLAEAGRKEIAKLQENFIKAQDERKEYQITMSRMANDKANLESDLYSAFLPILNAKQEKIRELQDQLEQNDSMETDHDSKKTATTTHTISSSEEDENDANASQNFLTVGF